MFGSGDSTDRGHEGFPCAALRLQHFLPFGRQFVIAPPPLPRLLHPLPLDPAALLKPVEQRIERGDVETQRPARTGLDQFGNVVAMPGPDLNEREDQQLGAALLQFAVENSGVYICHSHILCRLIYGVNSRFTFLAIFALAFASMGMYAVISQSVNQRMREMAIRAATGASESRLWRLM